MTTKGFYVAVKWVLIAAALGFLFWLATQLAAQGMGAAIAAVAFVAMCILLIYSRKRFVPMKYLFPGILALLGLQIWPMLFTVSIAFTNYGQGHPGTKEDSITQILANSVQEVPNTPRYKASVAVPDGASVTSAPLVLLLTAPDGKTYVGTVKGLEDLPAADVTKTSVGKITAAKGYVVLGAREVNARSKDLGQLAVPTDNGGGIKLVGLSEAFVGKSTMSYDQGADTLTDSRTKKSYAPKNAFWTATDGSGDTLSMGWKEGVGLKNFQTIFTDETIRSGFLGIFIWNVFFAAATVVLTFVLGMLIALLFNHPRLRGKSLYRSLLILPYAIPSFVTALLWRGMFNQDYGLINTTLHMSTDWLGNDWAARAALLITNTWLGFPYMFLVCTGALQSIPSDVKEAAKIDGANGFQTLRKITMPLLLVAVGPLLIASYGFNFNNFSLVYLLTQGGPFNAGNTSIGSTDLLITYAYRLAFAGSAPSYGLAAAVSVIIFFLVAMMSLPGFRATKQLEEVN